MQPEQRNSIGPLTTGSIGRVSRTVPTAHTYVSSALPTVSGSTTSCSTLTTALGVSNRHNYAFMRYV